MIYAGCFDSFNNRKTLIENLDSVLDYVELTNGLDSSLVEKPILEEYEEYSKEELTNQENESYGFYLS